MIRDAQGAIIRGDTSSREIALVFTGDEFGDGGESIRRTLRSQGVKASFFFTGRFYANPAFHSLIRGLKRDGHYLGAHSDRHLLYCDWENRDSLLVDRDEFRRDLEANYRKMAVFGIGKEEAPYFLPPFEWYNATITEWAGEEGLKLISFSPGTLSAADYTFPAMGSRYRSSDEIYRSVLNHEQTDPSGLNGFVLLLHIGTDPRRTDKFYPRLGKLLRQLSGKGYGFVRIDELF